MTLNFSRYFMLLGALYLLVGIGIGMYMGSSGDRLLTPLHAHINLVGFVLMTIFGLILRVVPAMAGNVLAALHFWLYQVGALVMMVVLYLLIEDRMSEDVLGPLIFLAELLVLAGVLAFIVNLFRNT